MHGKLWFTWPVAAAVMALADPAQATVTFTFTGSIQHFVVPQSGIYEIAAAGAQGASIEHYGDGGRGALIGGQVSLTKGENLAIVAGGQGSTDDGGDWYTSAGGGGGSFVVIQTLSDFVGGVEYAPLVIAGGGGGAAYGSTYSNGGSGGPGLTGTAGGSGLTVISGMPACGGVGGTGGKGGQAAQTTGDCADKTPPGNASGGGGFVGNGASGDPGQGGVSFLLGSAGGYFNSTQGRGGFGGGGTGGFDSNGGGGGGYSGGGGGWLYEPGGGGGSYFPPLGYQDKAEAGENSGNGYVSISPAFLIAEASAVPEPATWVMMLIGFGAVGAATRRKRRSAVPALA